MLCRRMMRPMRRANALASLVLPVRISLSFRLNTAFSAGVMKLGSEEVVVMVRSG